MNWPVVAQIRREKRKAEAPPPAPNFNVLVLALNPELQDEDADADSESESKEDKEMVAVKRTAEGEQSPKNPRRENEEESMQVPRPPISLPSGFTPFPGRVSTTLITKPKKTTSHRKKFKSTVFNELGDRMKKYDLMNSFPPDLCRYCFR